LLGTSTVAGFQSLTGINLASPIAASSIGVTPSGGANPSLLFGLSISASNGQLLEALFTYTISGQTYNSDSASSVGTSVSGNGAVTDIQNYCLGGSFDATGVSNCSTGKAGMIVLLGDGSQANPFSPAASITVTNDLTFDSGGPGAGNLASGGKFTDSFTAAAPVPEPGSTGLITAALIAAALARRIQIRFRRS
jgi:hypothetical protein